MTNPPAPAGPGGARVDLRVAGEVDVASAPDVERDGLQALTDSAVLTVALDLSGVTFIDSSGIGTLVRLRLCADQHHKQLLLVQPSEQVRRLLAITALTAAFGIDDPSVAGQA